MDNLLVHYERSDLMFIYIDLDKLSQILYNIAILVFALKQ
nr:MAG TPA_asm: hypothetical protein [Caudoviricetes sp.]